MHFSEFIFLANPFEQFIYQFFFQFWYQSIRKTQINRNKLPNDQKTFQKFFDTTPYLEQNILLKNFD